MQVRYGLLLFSMFVLSVATGGSLLSQESPKFLRSYEAAYSLPRPLSKDDSFRYMRIFELQKKGHWKRSQNIIAQLSNKLLLGHVLAQKFLHPTKYRSK